ncbi:uncharacterized protein LOC134717538 [Mytilus trossulus]|uniref:uncharacterized protein LOC134717538 n=1 Tax=Mytilus trossulus TaxID=6551 RepID=UPI0030051901
MCTSTRFPETIPLKNIKTPTIVKVLIKFFHVSRASQVYTVDQGSSFMSGLFQQVVFQLGIAQFRSSAYHPESQGALERFHQTFKNMIRTFCLQFDRDWDDGVHFLLFAVREAVQESFGFSPFELAFGHARTNEFESKPVATLGMVKFENNHDKPDVIEPTFSCKPMEETA